MSGVWTGMLGVWIGIEGTARWAQGVPGPEGMLEGLGQLRRPCLFVGLLASGLLGYCALLGRAYKLLLSCLNHPLLKHIFL